MRRAWRKRLGFTKSARHSPRKPAARATRRQRGRRSWRLGFDSSPNAPTGRESSSRLAAGRALAAARSRIRRPGRPPYPQTAASGGCSPHSIPNPACRAWPVGAGHARDRPQTLQSLYSFAGAARSYEWACIEPRCKPPSRPARCRGPAPPQRRLRLPSAWLNAGKISAGCSPETPAAGACALIRFSRAA